MCFFFILIYQRIFQIPSSFRFSQNVIFLILRKCLSFSNEIWYFFFYFRSIKLQDSFFLLKCHEIFLHHGLVSEENEGSFVSKRRWWNLHSVNNSIENGSLFPSMDARKDTITFLAYLLTFLILTFVSKV